MNKNKFIQLSVSLLIGFSMFFSLPAHTASTIANGVYTPGVPEDVTQIDNFTTMTGHKPTIIMWYEDWAHNTTFPSAKMTTVYSKGAVPMLTWEPWDYSQGVYQSKYSLAAIAKGNFDPFIKQYARNAATYGKPFYLRFAHEQNGNWYPWGTGVNGNRTGDYIKAWQHVYTIFQQQGATNARFVWCPNVGSLNAMATTFPGDNYVQYVGLDGYNWGDTQSWSSWQSLASIFETSYDKLTTLSQKSVFIAETASTESGGDKAAWITSGLLNDVPTRLPKVKAVIWFNANKETDWRVNSSDTALSAYKNVINQTLYQGGAP